MVLPVANIDEITAVSYNLLQSRVYNILGAGTGQFGYGKTLTSVPVSRGTDILALQWASLKFDILTASYHQGNTTVANIQNLPTANLNNDFYVTAQDYALFDSAISTIQANSFALGPGQYSDESMLTPSGGPVTSIRTANWGSIGKPTVSHNFTVSFNNSADARYFFNAGGSIRLTPSLTGISNTSQNRAWTRLLTAIGTVIFNHATTTASAGSGSAIGFYDLTTTPKTVFTAQGSGSYVVAAYASSTYVVKMSCDVANNTNGGATQIFVTIDFNDKHVNVHYAGYIKATYAYSGYGDNINGTLTSAVNIRRASGSYVNVVAPKGTNTKLLSA